MNAVDGMRRLHLLLDAVVDYAIYMIDLDGHVVSWNAGAARLKGYSADEIIGQSFRRFYTPEDRDAGAPQRALARARATGRFHGEGWRVRKDGTRFWASIAIDAIRDEKGELIGFAKVTRDMTERREAQQKLQESEKRYRTLVDSVVDYAIFQLDREGYLTTWNAGAERIKGYRPDEIIGKHFSHFYTEEDRRAGVPEKALAAAAEQGRYEVEGWRIRKDGSRFFASVVIDPIRDESGKVTGFAKVTRDVTERHEAQRLLKETQEQLAVAQRMEAVGQLSGGIAHDFNNLLMIVLGNLENAQRHAKRLSGGKSLERALANATHGAQRAAALTNGLLAFSRRQALVPKPLDVNKFLTGLVEFLQRSLGELIEIEAVGGAGLWQVEVDVNHLESALVNLAINARDAMPQGGKLTIEAANVFADAEYTRANPEMTPGQYVVICVTDTGTGMSAEVLNRVFEPFFTTKEIGHGTGLGLSQVYGFVKQSGGHVNIYSEPGHGTTVKIYLPRAVVSGSEDRSDEDHEIPMGELNEAVLVVEDNSDLRAYLVDLLRRLGYRVLSAPDGQGALEILEQENRTVDLLLTDIVMPGIDGRELGRRAQAIRPGLPTLYMTGYSRNAVLHQGRIEEGINLLQKPISQSQIAARVREVLDRVR